MENIICTKSSGNLRILHRSRGPITMVTGAIRFKVDSRRPGTNAKAIDFAIRLVLEKRDFKGQHTLVKPD